MHMADACIICVGDELLSGRTLNTNAGYISRKLSDYGISVKRHITVNDRKSDIVRELKYAVNDYDFVFITGGLGPTDDDITLPAVSAALQKDLAIDEHMTDYLRKRVPRMNDDIIKKLALRIEDSDLLDNNEGVVPGQHVHCGNTSVFLLPGVHNEVVSIFSNGIAKIMENYAYEKSSVLRLYAIREVELMNNLTSFLGRNTVKKIAFLPSYGYVDIVLYNTKFSKEEQMQLIDHIEKQLKEHMLENDSHADIALQLGETLRKQSLTIAFAESCTGGMLAKRMTDFAGASDYFAGGAVTYSNQSKVQLLHVDEHLIEKAGAVSEEVAKEMAESAARVFGADLGLGITGIAGPGGGSREKPVGLVYASIYLKGHHYPMKMQFTGSRNTIRSMAAVYILFKTRKLIDE